MHHEAAQDHTGHDGHDVARMLSKGREAHDSQDPAHCGPIQVPAGEQDHPHCDQPVDPHVDQHRRRAKHAQIVAGGPAAGLEQAAVTRPGRPDRLPAEKQAGKDGCYAHRPQQPAEQSVVPCGPEVRDLRLRPEGAHQGHQQHGHQPAGKPYIVQVHPVLDLVCIGGQRGHYKADHQAGRHPKHRGAPAVVQDDIADDRPQGRGQQGHGRILSKGLLSALSVQPSPQDDGPGVDRVLPKQGKPRHQSYHHQREAVGRFPRAAQDQHREGGDYRGVDQGCSHAGQPDIVSDEGVLRHHDADQAPCNIVRGIQQRARQEKPGGKDQQHDIQGLVPHVACIL